MAPENKLVAISSFREARRWTCRSPPRWPRGGRRERESPTRDRSRIFSPGRTGSANPQTAPISGPVGEGDFGPRLTADGALRPTIKLTIRYWPPGDIVAQLACSVTKAPEPRDRARFSYEMCTSGKTQPNLRQQAIPAGRLLYFLRIS